MHVGERKGGRNTRFCDLCSNIHTPSLSQFSVIASFRKPSQKVFLGHSPDPGDLPTLHAYPYYIVIKKAMMTFLVQVLPLECKQSGSQHHICSVHSFTFFRIGSGKEEVLKKLVLNDSLTNGEKQIWGCPAQIFFICVLLMASLTSTLRLHLTGHHFVDCKVMFACHYQWNS